MGARSRAAIGVWAILGIVACAGASSPPAAKPAPPQIDDSPLGRVARQCTKIASCPNEHEASAFRAPQACVDWYLVNAQSEAPLAECMMRAKDCAEALACTRESADAVAERYCKAHPGALTACDGNHLISCEGEGAEESVATDCAAIGGTCGERRPGGPVGIAERGCLSERMCPPGAPEHRCDGESAVIDCNDGIAQRNVCPPGSRCAADRDESGAATAQCRAASGRECTMGGAAFCEGDVAFACVQSGRFRGLHSADCGAFGLGCVVRSGRVFCAPRGEAPCAAGAASCSGDDLAFCAAGQSFRVSCKQLGFAGCDPSGGGKEALCAAKSPR